MSAPHRGGESRRSLARELDELLDTERALFEELRGARLLITGATGFFGCWLLEALTWAEARLSLGLTVLGLTRDPTAFARRAPHLAMAPAVHWLRGDALDFSAPTGGFSHLVHAATPTAEEARAADARPLFHAVVEGARRALDRAVEARAARVLLVSSGAVNGPQPKELRLLPEEHPGGPDPTARSSWYGEGKRAAELLAALYADAAALPVTIARGFAFAGPYLPLDAHFAFGNFLGDALAGRPIRVQGDGSAVRSYLYGAELAAWLLAVLVRGAPGRAYNVGSERAVTVRQLAELVVERLGGEVVVQGGPSAGAARYVPETARARRELGVVERVSLEEAIDRTARFHRAR